MVPRPQGTAGGRPAGRSELFAAANAGEPEALEVLRRFCHAVAVQIYNLTVLLDVEKVAIGGGISKQPLLLESLRSAYDGLYASRAGQAYMEGLPRCQIVPCAFSSEANQVGVAAAYFEAMQKNVDFQPVSWYYICRVLCTQNTKQGDFEP